MRVRLDIPLTVSEICSSIGTGSNEEAWVNQRIHYISTDTRECREGDLFIALDGENGSGEKYVCEAVAKDCAVISRSNFPGVIRVDDTADALLNIAKYYKSKTEIKHTIAVTGSVGKSTTVRFISRILGTRYKVHSPIGNYNNHIGLPLTVLSAEADTEVLVVELGMNHKNEISRLSKCVSPDISIITSIGTSHIGNLGSRDEIAKAKLEIKDGMSRGLLLLPYGEPLLGVKENALYVATSSPLSDFSLNKTKSDKLLFTSPNESFEIKNPPPLQPHLLTNLAFAISAAKLLNLSSEEINKGVDAITKSDLRQRFIELSDYTIFDDSYNASLESIKADIEYICTLDRPRGAFLGDILELGDESEIIHERIGSIAAKMKIDRLYLFGKHATSTARGAIAEGMDQRCIYVNTELSSPEESISHIKNNHAHNEIILFKASHKLRLDKIADTIAKEEGIDK